MNLQSGAQPLTSPTGELYRCFYAIRFAEEVNAYLASVIEALKRHRAEVHWIPTRNLHLTLRFLGDLTPAQFMAARTVPQIGEGTSPFSLRVSGLGAFPLLRAPRILWAGVEGETVHDTDMLLHIQGRTEEWARRIGLPREERRYSPHITLGRVVRGAPGLKSLTDDIAGRDCRSEFCTIGEIILMRSTLTREGSVYETVEKYEVPSTKSCGSRT